MPPGSPTTADTRASPTVSSPARRRTTSSCYSSTLPTGNSSSTKTGSSCSNGSPRPRSLERDRLAKHVGAKDEREALCGPVLLHGRERNDPDRVPGNEVRRCQKQEPRRQPKPG